MRLNDARTESVVVRIDLVRTCSFSWIRDEVQSTMDGVVGAGGHSRGEIFVLEQTLASAAHHPFRRPAQRGPGAVPTPLEARHRKPALSAREIEVMLAWFASDSKTVAARSVYISVGTINTHITRIRQKYAAVGRSAPTKAALFARALQDGHTHLSEW